MLIKSTLPSNWFHKFTGPLAPFRESFATSLENQGFDSVGIRNRLRPVFRFSLWLNDNGVTASHIKKKHVQAFYDDKSVQHIGRFGYLPALNMFLVHLRDIGVIQSLSCTDLTNQTPVQIAVQEYKQHLRDYVGLTKHSITKYSPFVEDFLNQNMNEGEQLENCLTASRITTYFTQLAPTVSKSRSKSAATAIRSYLRFLRFTGALTSDLVGSVPTVPKWSLVDIPRSISEEHTQIILERCARDTTQGLRDYTILTLLSRLALRSSEIVSLNLDSIDWTNGLITINGKGGVEATLPLPNDVGEILVDYLKRGRPDCQSRAFFVRSCAPFRALGSATTVGTIVKAAIVRAGVTPPTYGSHQFRHALACTMTNRGATLDEIGIVLRHRQAKTTRQYAKVDLSSLRTLCLPLPGETS